MTSRPNRKSVACLLDAVNFGFGSQAHFLLPCVDNYPQANSNGLRPITTDYDQLRPITTIAIALWACPKLFEGACEGRLFAPFAGFSQSIQHMEFRLQIADSATRLFQGSAYSACSAVKSSRG